MFGRFSCQQHAIASKTETYSLFRAEDTIPINLAREKEGRVKVYVYQS